MKKKILLIFLLPVCTFALFGATGDVNGDSTITIVDASMTAQYYVGMEPAGFILSAADINNDGGVTIVDALIMAQIYVGLVDPPAEEPGSITLEAEDGYYNDAIPGKPGVPFLRLST